MKRFTLLILCFLVSACTTPTQIVRSYELSQIDVPNDLEHHFDELFTRAQKYESEQFIGYRVKLGTHQNADEFYRGLRLAVGRSCPSSNSAYAFYSGGTGSSLRMPLELGPESMAQLPIPANAKLGKWETNFNKLDDVMCSSYDDTTSYPTKRTVRSLQYIKILREFEANRSDSDRHYSNGYAHVLLIAPEFVYEQLILPALKRYEKSYIVRMERAKFQVAHLHGQLADGIAVRLNPRNSRENYDLVYNFNNNGQAPIRLDVSNIGYFRSGNTTYATTYTESSTGSLIAFFNSSGGCTPVDNDHTVIVNPGSRCTVRVPISIHGARLSVDKPQALFVNNKWLQFDSVSMYEVMEKHPLVFATNED